jgi:hypothetical protein
LGLVLLAAFSKTLRKHLLIALLRNSMLAACFIAMALIAASSFVEVCIPVSRSKAIGIEGHSFFLLEDKGRTTWPTNTPTWKTPTKAYFNFIWPPSFTGPSSFQTGGIDGRGHWLEKSHTEIVPLFFAFLLPPLFLLLLRSKSALAGKCGRCEYDLTGNVSGVCPECGGPIPRHLD